jgi:excisionase family DNA binding protein
MVVEPARPGRILRHGDAPTGTEDMMAEHELLTPSEVAVMFRVDPKTVTRWARAGRLSSIRTIGGHRRFRTSEVQRFLDAAWELPA